MLPHLHLFCNCFSPYPHSQGDRSGTDRHPRRGRAHLMVLVGSAWCQTGPRRCSAVCPPRALTSYDAQATQTIPQQAVVNARPWHTHDLAWQQQRARLRTTRSCQAPAGRTGTQRACLIAAGIPAVALALAPPMSLRKPVAALPGETVWGHDDGGCINTCVLGPLCTVDSPRCRPDDHALTRHPQPYLLAPAAGVLSMPDCCAGVVLKHTHRWHIGGRTYWRRPHVPTGDAPTYLLATPPRTYWRRPHVPTGDAPRTYWRRKPS